MTHALLMSSSRKENLGYLGHAQDQLSAVLEGTSGEILFVPYAAVSFSYEAYEELASPAFAVVNARLRSIHHLKDPVSAVREADVVAVGGGNTFALLSRLYENELVVEIRRRVLEEGMRYIGWSAGTNVATTSIRTTNDMPILQPPSFAGLGLVPFQINPHFIPGKPLGHNGESREERLHEFTSMNPGEEVLALPEGSALHVVGEQAEILGEKDALIFSQGGSVRPLERGERFALSSVKGPAAS